MVYILVAILALCIFFILPLKKLFNRDRPTRILSVYRICNMRDLEHGKAMPSGDAAAGAFFCGIYAYLFGLPFYAWAIFTILVSLGRVYVHCHWIGDTIAGSILGVAFTYFTFSEAYMGKLSYPLFVALVGNE